MHSHSMRLACAAILAPSIAVPTACIAQSLTTDAPNNGRSDDGAGVFLDITPYDALSITGIEYYASSTAGTPTTLEIWLYPGSYVGNDGNSTGWYLHDTIPAVSQGNQIPAPVTFNIPLEIPAGTTQGIYIVTINGGIRYTGTGQVSLHTNADLELFSERARGGPPWTGTLFTPRTFAGTIFYELGSTHCYANCNGSTTEPILTVDDFTCFINEFAAAQGLPYEQQVTHYANCNGSTNAPVLTVDDFTCFINEFAQGCP